MDITATWLPTGVQDLDSLCCEMCGTCYNQQEYAHFFMQKKAGLFKLEINNEHWLKSGCYKCVTSLVKRITEGIVEINVKHRTSTFKLFLFEDD